MYIYIYIYIYFLNDMFGLAIHLSEKLDKIHFFVIYLHKDSGKDLSLRGKKIFSK
jgi:hypothetical protein